MPKRSFPLSKVYKLIEPGPVVMVSTVLKGRPNVMTMSWHTMIDFNPPLLGLVVGDQSYTFQVLKAAKECVVNIPTAALAKKAVACGNVSGRTIDKFKTFHLTPVKASCVRAPMVGECYAHLECKVINQSLAKQYNFFILKVVRAWVDPRRKNPRIIRHLGEGVFVTNGKKFKLPSQMK